MSEFTVYIDGIEIAARSGQTVIEAAELYQPTGLRPGNFSFFAICLKFI